MKIREMYSWSVKSLAQLINSLTEIVWDKIERELDQEFKEHDVIVLNKDFADLKIGTIGTVLHIHIKKYTHYEIEFVNSNVQTIGIYTVPAEYLTLLISRNTPK